MAVAYEPPDPDALLGLGEVAAAGGHHPRHRPGVVPSRPPAVRAPGRATSRSSARRDLERVAGRPRRGRRRRSGPSDGSRPPAATPSAVSPSEVSGQLDLDRCFEERSATRSGLFALARIGLWLYDPHRGHPFSLAAQHGLADEVLDWVVDARPRFAGRRDRRRSETGTSSCSATSSSTRRPGRPATSTRGTGSGASASRRSIFRGEPLGLLVLYHDRVHDWSAEETALARGFADQMATAVGNARLTTSVQSLAAPPRGGPGPRVRLNRTHDIGGIAEVIVEGTER